ncbi:MAG: outer membrane beta-barrel protein [Bacteroidales bacterium]|jgi:hypothetical protein|nr:outer membrane beta-barrel protein [Bacteroidales bacterium]
MKRVIYLLIFVVLASVNAVAQNTSLYGGLVISDALFFIDQATIDPQKKAGVVFGLDNEFKVAGNLYLGAGIEYSGRGYRVKSDTNNFSTAVNYVNFPVTGRYKFNLEDLLVSFELGPFLGVALSGKTIQDDGTEIDYDFGKGEGELSHIDYGFILGYAVEFEGVKLRFAYNAGLKNISSSRLETIKNRAFTLTAAVSF